MRRLGKALSLAMVWTLAWPVLVAAQSVPAVLIADRVSVTAEGQLIAEGRVEVFQGTRKITASRITYDRNTERLTIEGPVRLTDGDSATVLAEEAEIDRDLRDGLLRGARMVLDQQLQLSAAQLSRSEGRYSELYKTSVTSCRVCAEGRAPLWQIRARRVVHDQVERQLYFENARLMVLGLPVFYLPYMRMPDPTVDRASGFLVPSWRRTSRLGFGVRVPYFFKLSDRSDLTLTPYLSKNTRTLGLRYRRAFLRGRIELEGAVTDDDVRPGETRGYFFGSGAFLLPRDFQLSFRLKWASDNAYLEDYGLPSPDRLESEIALTRAKRDSFLRAAVLHYNSLRDGEDDSVLPTEVLDLDLTQRYHPAAFGGELRLSLLGHAHRRDSNRDPEGRDVSRATADVNWRDSRIFETGLRGDWRLGLAVDLFDIDNDSAFQGTQTRSTPYAALTFRLPMTRRSAEATQFVEPIVQLGWSDVSGDDVPNDESNRVEFDQGNLLSLSRFPSPDVREDGWALAYGANWARFASGWEASLSVGHVLRQSAQSQFSRSSGLSGTRSDLLVAGQLRRALGLDLTARALFDESFGVNKAELRGAWQRDRAALSGTYVWLREDSGEDRLRDTSEVILATSYQIDDNWSVEAGWRYDATASRATREGIGVSYVNECVEVGLTVTRRNTVSESIEPSTDFGFNIVLRGFGAGRNNEASVRSCNS